MPEHDRFNEMYQNGDTPWELDRPDANLIREVVERKILPCKTLEMGCGSGSNAIWLAQQGFDVTGTDYSPLAIEKAKEKALEKNLEDHKLKLYVNDFLTQKVGDGDFEFLFDRGCFHTFADHEDRVRFAENANAHLIPKGRWLSLIGNADAPKREDGPPVRTAKEIIDVVEPYFEILSLVAGFFDSKRETPPRNWICYMQKR